MKTYRDELTAAIRGNARLRRRLEAKERRIEHLEYAMYWLLAMCDSRGLGDDDRAKYAASTVGWKRDSSVSMKCREAMG